MNSSDIQYLIKQMDISKEKHKSLKSTNFDEYVRLVALDCPVLFKDYDLIFKKHIEDKLDERIFYMLAQLRKRETGKVSNEKAEKNVVKYLGSKRHLDEAEEATEVDLSSNKKMSYMDFVDE